MRICGPQLNKQERSAIERLDNVIRDMADHIDGYVRNPGHDFTRKRKLDAETFIKTTLNMQGGSLNAELLEAFEDPDKRMSVSAYEQAKDKATPSMFEHLFWAYNRTIDWSKADKLYNWPVFAIDGSTHNVPYREGSKYVVSYSENVVNSDGSKAKPFSQMHVNCLMDVTNRLFLGGLIQPKDEADEREAALTLLHNLHIPVSYIVTFDRGYESFNMFESLNRLPGCKWVMRVRLHGGIKEIDELPDKQLDRPIEFKLCTSVRQKNDNPDHRMLLVHENQYKEELSANTNYQQWDFESPYTIRCRVVKFQINDPESGRPVWEVLLTNLTRFEFNTLKMKELYHMRWGIETAFRQLKYDIGSIAFHSRKDDFLQMEMFVHLIVFNLVSRCMAPVKIEHGKRKYEYAIDFSMAVRIVRKAFHAQPHSPPEKMYAEIGRYIHPIRKGRKDKRRMKPKSATSFWYRLAA